MTEAQIQWCVEDAIREAEEELSFEGKTLTAAQARCIERTVRYTCAIEQNHLARS